MLTLDPGRLAGLAIPIGTGWLPGACMEARGKQDLRIRRKPEVRNALREQALIQSAESSNRIEGVTVAASRLRPLVIGRATPRDRAEEELAGYRAALDWIFSRKNRVAGAPTVEPHRGRRLEPAFSPSSEAGLDPKRCAGHSLRAGFAARAFLNGVTEASIMRQTRHKPLNTPRKHIRDRSLFRDNPAAKLGL